MVPALRRLLEVMPFLFGIGFIAPLIAQIMMVTGLEAPWGMSRVTVGLVLGAGWGSFATWRGRWL